MSVLSLAVPCSLFPVPSQTVYAADIMKGVLTDVAGDVEIQKRGSSDFIPASNGMNVTPGDQISTGIDGRVTLKYENSSTTIEPLTQFVVGRTIEGDKEYYTELFLQVGKVVSKVDKDSGKKNKFSVTTPTAVAGVRGTIQEVSFLPAVGTEVKITDGEGYMQPVQAERLPPAVAAMLGLAPAAPVAKPGEAEGRAGAPGQVKKEDAEKAKKEESKKVEKVEEAAAKAGKDAGDKAKAAGADAAKVAEVASKAAGDAAKEASKEAGLSKEASAKAAAGAAADATVAAGGDAAAAGVAAKAATEGMVGADAAKMMAAGAAADAAAAGVLAAGGDAAAAGAAAKAAAMSASGGDLGMAAAVGAGAAAAAVVEQAVAQGVSAEDAAAMAHAAATAAAGDAAGAADIAAAAGAAAGQAVTEGASGGVVDIGAMIGAQVAQEAMDAGLVSAAEVSATEPPPMPAAGEGPAMPDAPATPAEAVADFNAFIEMSFDPTFLAAFDVPPAEAPAEGLGGAPVVTEPVPGGAPAPVAEPLPMMGMDMFMDPAAGGADAPEVIEIGSGEEAAVADGGEVTTVEQAQVAEAVVDVTSAGTTDAEAEQLASQTSAADEVLTGGATSTDEPLPPEPEPETTSTSDTTSTPTPADVPPSPPF